MVGWRRGGVEEWSHLNHLDLSAEPLPEPGPELELVEPETDPDADDF